MNRYAQRRADLYVPKESRYAQRSEFAGDLMNADERMEMDTGEIMILSLYPPINADCEREKTTPRPRMVRDHVDLTWCPLCRFGGALQEEELHFMT